MSRYEGWNEGDGDYPYHWWQRDLERALTSGRGIRLLRKVEESLLALPVRELIADEIISLYRDDHDRPIEGSVCAVGAFARFCFMERGSTHLEALEILDEQYGHRDADAWVTQRLGMSHGLARTVAYELGWLNDEQFGHLKPRQRWRAMLRWVRERIREGEQVQAKRKATA